MANTERTQNFQVTTPERIRTDNPGVVTLPVEPRILPRIVRRPRRGTETRPGPSPVRRPPPPRR